MGIGYITCIRAESFTNISFIENTTNEIQIFIKKLYYNENIDKIYNTTRQLAIRVTFKFVTEYKIIAFQGL